MWLIPEGASYLTNSVSALSGVAAGAASGPLGLCTYSFFILKYRPLLAPFVKTILLFKCYSIHEAIDDHLCWKG